MNLTPLQIIGIVLVINGALIGATTQLTNLFGQEVANAIVSIASIGNSIFGGIVTMLSSQGAQIKNVAAMRGIEPLRVNAMANSTVASLALDPTQEKIAPLPAAQNAVEQIAKGA